MSLSLDRESKPAPLIQLRAESLAAPEAQPPMQVIRRNGTVSKFDAGKISDCVCQLCPVACVASGWHDSTRPFASVVTGVVFGCFVGSHEAPTVC